MQKCVAFLFIFGTNYTQWTIQNYYNRLKELFIKKDM